ncbi:MAG: tetratricopeptide repeat protein [Bacteroidales bacterium]
MLKIKVSLRQRLVLYRMRKAKKHSDAKHYDKAFRYYRASAEAGCVRAVCIMGLMYCQGKGVAKNEYKAFRYLCFSAQNNDGEAQFFLGEMYRMGIATEVNCEQALYWYQQSAFNPLSNESCLNAQYQLACMLYRGEGIPPNREMALYWLQQAVGAGYEPAEAFCKANHLILA